MTLPDILLTKEDFITSAWTEVFGAVEENECHSYNTYFSNKDQEFREKSSEKEIAIFGLLSVITSFHFTPESASEPFVPLFQMQGRRGLIPSDLTPNHIQSLEVFFELIEDDELKARTADVLWLLKHDHKKAESAVEAYLVSAKKLEDPDMWPPAADRIERALRLAISLRNKDLIDKVVLYIESTIKKLNGTDRKFFTSKLMEFLIEIKRGKPEECIPLAKSVAQKALADHDWHKARTYFEIESRWHGIAGSESEKQKALLQEAEVYVQEAEATAVSANPSYLAATFHLQKAIEAFRRIGGQQARVDEVHKRLLEYEKQISNEMHSISHEMDLTEQVQQSIDIVKGKSFDEAIRILALSCKSPQVKRLEQRVKKLMSQSPLQFIMSHHGINAEGKIVARRPAMDVGGSDEDNQNAIRASMFEQAAMIDIPINTQAIIEPARSQIAFEHHGSPQQFFSLVRNNPFVPEGRESLYARALSAGFEGDLVEFLSIGTPQFENSIRYILGQHGITTSGIDSDGIQEEYDLNRLLFMAELKPILGEDIVFDLQGLLVVHAGANLRNRFAHGLIDHDGFYSFHVIYFWWLMLRIIVLGVMISEKRGQPKQSEKKDDIQK